MPWTVDELTRWLDEIEPRMEALDLFAWLELTPMATPLDIQPAFHAVARTRHPDLFRNKLAPADQDRLMRVYARITAAYAELRDPLRCSALARELRFGSRRVAATRPPGATEAGPAPLSRTPTSTASAPMSRPASVPPQVARTVTPVPAIARTATGPQVSRTTTPPPQVARTTTGPQLAGTPAPGVPIDVSTSAAASAPAASEDLEPSRAMSPRALAYYRRAEGALRVGDHATALLQLRMALATDPGSPLLRAALQELLEAMKGR
jgi:hypothetical protein